QWVNTVLGNLKTSLAGSYHAFNFRKYAARYLGAFAYRFNRRFDLRTLPARLLVAVACCTPAPSAGDSGWLSIIANQVNLCSAHELCGCAESRG
ncbi:transposase, partial [Azotobacter beijerinckii]|uniref:transposase n=1 Tax=Azotobacter beijerinckii TaxID=170623 RepID=UPI002952C265